MWHTTSREALGSLLALQFEISKGEALDIEKEIYREIELFEDRYSRFRTGNTLEKLNSRIGEWQTIDEETFSLLSRLWDILSGIDLGFSLAVKTSLESLGYDQNYSFIKKKTPTRIVGTWYELRHINTGPEVYLTDPIEFGGFGKWHALDIAVRILQSRGVQNFLCNFGGDIAAFGVNPTWDTWTIGLEHPSIPDQVIGTLELRDGFFAVSGPAKRRWGKNSEFHHLIDPLTGLPSESWLAVYVIGNTWFEADVLATGISCTSEIWLISSLDGFRNSFLAIRPDETVYSRIDPSDLAVWLIYWQN